MGTLLEIVDFIVLLLLIVKGPRTVRKELSQGTASLVLLVVVALALIVFACVSFASYAGLVGASSSLTRGIFLVVLLILAAIVRPSSEGKPAA